VAGEFSRNWRGLGAGGRLPTTTWAQLLTEIVSAYLFTGSPLSLSVGGQGVEDQTGHAHGIANGQSSTRLYQRGFLLISRQSGYMMHDNSTCKHNSN